MSTPHISIVIPTCNGIETLPGVLDALERQTVDCPTEIIAIDTASSDGTRELIEARATQVMPVDADGFNHGETRNRAIAAARGEFVVLLSQDAEPIDDRWLMRLIAPLRERPDVAGTFARQVPRPDLGVIGRHYHDRWVAASAQPSVRRVESADAFARLPPLDRLHACAFDNVCSSLRRSVWQRHPFRQVPIAEDLEWARDVLLAGHAIEYVPGAVVRHSHSRPAWYEFKRTLILHHRLAVLFGVRTVPSAAALGRAIASTVSLHMRSRRLAAPGTVVEGLPRALALAVAWPAGQYAGGLAAALGWTPAVRGV